MTNVPAKQFLQPNHNQADDEIDLREVVGALLRRWPLIIGSGALGLILSGIYLHPKKSIYQGEFQIVLGQEKAQSGAFVLLSKNPGLAAIAGSEQPTNPLPPKFKFSTAHRTEPV